MNNSERFARRLSGLEKRLRDMESTPQLAYSSIEDGAISEYDENGNLVSRIGKQHDGTHGSAPLDGPIPPTPVAPTAEGGQASITITYDGRYEDDRRAPLDLHVIEVYAAEEPFTQRTEAHLVGSLPDEAGGTFTFRRPPGVWYVGLVAKSVPGRRSPVSELASAEATSVVDPAIMAELEDRLDTAETEIDAANEWLNTSGAELGTRMDEAFGRIEDVEGAATSAQATADDAASAAGTAQGTADAAIIAASTAQDAADGKPLMLFDSGTPSGTAPKGSIWWQRDAQNNVIGQWQQTGDGVNDTWTRQDVSSEAIANLDVGKLTAGSAVIDDAVIAVLWADVVRAGFLGADEAIIGGAVLKDDAIQAKHIVASESMWAKVLGAHQITADEIDVEDLSADTAFIAELEAAILKANSIKAHMLDVEDVDPATGQRLTLTHDGVRLWSGSDDTGEPTISITTSSAQTLSILDENDEKVAGMDASGTVLGGTVSATNSLRYRGDEIGELLDSFPKGVIARSTATNAGLVSLVGAGTTPICEARVTLQPGRHYEVYTSNLATRTLGTGRFDYYIHWSTDGTLPNVSDPRLEATFVNSSGSGFHNAHLGPRQVSVTEETDAWFVLFLSSPGPGVSIYRSWGNLAQIFVEDKGPILYETGSIWTGEAGASETPTAPPPAPKKYTKTYDYRGFNSFYQDNSVITAGPGATYAMQGYTSYYSPGGLQKSMLHFYDWTADLGGADIEKIEVYLHAEHWWHGSGGTAAIGLHGNYSTTSGWDEENYNVVSTHFGRGEAKWVTIPSNYYYKFRTGAVRGISLRAASTSSEYYGYFRPSASRVRITYRK